MSWATGYEPSLRRLRTHHRAPRFVPPLHRQARTSRHVLRSDEAMTHRPDTHDWFARATERRREMLEPANAWRFMRCAECGAEFTALAGMRRCSSCQSARALRSQIRVVA